MKSSASPVDRQARFIASVALGLAVIGLVLAGYSVALQSEQNEQLEAIREALEGSLRRPSADLPLQGPPPTLAD
ncbi:MAG: hypothetical protein AAGF12_19930 [Myxococcota bacterium]